ncbi:hypothetical protein Bache_3000 [Bacteroides helcogenes P 36-108]|uniref:Uncharacterized protein n=1 Tax=Bacteroides helcogenes (strain ATCC 35417 / DSM 20613 / JCM 6297 / CCUG 15421 / P 36-108) TaxID=693979 RepID=E6SPV4_BACT6|nr:hypothetical protein Bache_3000 [Bacteroides helcogenes P 36-108]
MQYCVTYRDMGQQVAKRMKGVRKGYKITSLNKQ